MNIRFYLIFFTLLCFFRAYSQKGSISGSIFIEGEPAAFAQISIDSSNIGTFSDRNGYFILKNINYGNYKLTASFIGYKRVKKELELNSENNEVNLQFQLNEPSFELDEIVVTGTKTFKRKTNSPVIVNVVSSETIENVQACNLSEGLRFQTGLRVETDCQTCNYTQLRMNGLAGGYSQILINGRPIFSPLTGLYGLEQIPANMIDRVEVIRGGGSSLYGSSAVGGTVNVITKIPRNNSYEINYTYQNIGVQTNDNNFSGNTTLVSKAGKSGISIFLNRRHRDFYDANGDNYSEIPLIKNTSVGSNLFLLPNENQKLEINFSYINEYRFGGEMLFMLIPHEAEQSEERKHNVLMGSADYQINFNNNNTSLISYLAWQNTNRTHYTGILPDSGTLEYESFIINPPYGKSLINTYNAGVQLNHKMNSFLGGKNTLTLGTEYILDDVYDEINAYQYLVDQTTKNFGLFLQSDWQLSQKLSLLSGVRMDAHNLVNKFIFNPRASLLYKPKPNAQFRINYGTGFRAPQAFDTDLHIAFSGGGISRVILSPDLKPETSNSISTSFNFDKPMKKWIGGFTIEGFYTQLNNAFYLQPIGEDQFGEIFNKKNGNGAHVQGITMELRTNYNRKVQLESGYTIQSSEFEETVQYIDGLPGIKEFIRTPNDYAYAILTYTPNKHFKTSINYLYTGSMKVPHFAGALNQSKDEIIITKTFSELSIKVAYTKSIKSIDSQIELYCGIKNIFNAYQSDFDIGKNRDSNFIYGPAQPRSFSLGLKLSSIK